MKKIFGLLMIVVALVSCNTNKCDIVGDIKAYDAENMLYLTDMWEKRAIIDSVEIDGGRFCFKGIKHTPTFAQLMTKSGRPITYLFVENGKVTISGNFDLDEISVGGTPANDAFEAMMIRGNKYVEEFRAAVGAGDKEKAQEVEAAYEAMQREFWTNNTNNPFGLFMLKQLSYSEPAVKLIEMLGQLSEELQALPYAVKMKESAERKLKTEPQAEGSDYVPYYINIEQPNLNGENVSLKSVVENKKNRYVLLDFWASWCGPCMAEMPHLKKAYKLYHKRGFEIYGVSFDAKKEAWQGAIEKQQMKWINVSTLEGFENPAAADYAVESIPTNFLIDCSNGVIIAKNLRGEAVLEKLAELLK